MILKFIYTCFVGILLATLIGVGIAAFYEGPVMPEYPSELKVTQPQPINEQTKRELIQKQQLYDQQLKEYQKKMATYNRNVSIIALLAAISIVSISLTFFKTILILADGLLLGGVLTLIYSIIRGFDTGNNKFRFLVVACGFIISIILGYIKFISPSYRKNG